MKKLLALILVLMLTLSAGILTAVAEAVDYDSMTFEQLLEKKGGYVGTAGLPDYWTDWGFSFQKIKEYYGMPYIKFVMLNSKVAQMIRDTAVIQ